MSNRTSLLEQTAICVAATSSGLVATLDLLGLLDALPWLRVEPLINAGERCWRREETVVEGTSLFCHSRRSWRLGDDERWAEPTLLRRPC